ncbi:MAG: hypothetical protein WBV82_26890 [Myxococcaceae bacterium]
MSALQIILTVALNVAPETGPAEPAPRFWLAAETGASLIEPSLHTALEGGYRLDRLGLLVRAEWNPWLTLQQPSARANRGVTNIGVGGELRYFGDRMRSALLVGASVLLFRSAFDAPGTIGPFVGIVPTSFRFPWGRHAVRVDPLSLYVLMPSLGSIPLVVIQYRHSVSLELTF